MLRVIVQCFLLGYTLVGASGCAVLSAGQSSALPQHTDGAVEREWWSARFRIYWPQSIEPDWAADYLLAHAVVAPVLHAHAERVPLWRFHRRAAPDAAGHQFSFIFYTDALTARSIKHAIEQQSAMRTMLAAGFVEKVSVSDKGYPQPERVAATSDKNWSPSMQRNWPAYIMGVSALWLGLVDEYAAAAPVPEDAAGMLSYYRQVEDQVTAQWRGEGLHALFHHLSAVFGYVPLPIGEQEVRF